MGAATEILHTQRRLGFFFSYLSVSFPNRDIIKLIWKHFVSTKKVQLNHDVQCIFVSAPPHACSKRFSHCLWCSLQVYSVHTPIPLVPGHCKTMVKDLCLLTKCTNTPLSPTPFLPLSSFPSFLRHNLQNAHKKFSFKPSYFFLSLIFHFSLHTFGEKQENISVSCPHTVSSAPEDRIRWQPAVPEMFEFNHCKSPLTAVPGVKNTKWKCTHVKLFKIAGIFCTHYGLSTSR